MNARVNAPNVAVVVGNPKPQSRTLAAATLLARELCAGLRPAGATAAEQGAPDLAVDLAEWGPRLLDWADEEVAALVAAVAAADLVVVATPTYKASFTGLLKLFLDRFGAGSLQGVAVPLMLGGSPAHGLAPEFTLRPVLTEISSTSPAKGLYVVDSSHDDPAAYADWLTTNRPAVQALVAARVAARNRTEEPA